MTSAHRPVPALRYPWTLVTPGAEAAAVWIPPGGTELTEREEAARPDLLTRAAGAEVAEAALTIYGQLEAAHPEEPCFHLSLLGVHDDHRGTGHVVTTMWRAAPSTRARG